MNDRDVVIVMEALFDIRSGVYTILDAITEDDDEEEAEEDEP